MTTKQRAWASKEDHLKPGSTPELLNYRKKSIFNPPTLHEVRIPPSNSKTRHLRSPNYPTRLFFTLADFVSGFSLVNRWAPHVRPPRQQGGAYMAAAQVAGRWPGRRACDGGEPVARRRSSGDARAAQRGRRDAGKPTGRLTATG